MDIGGAASGRMALWSRTTPLLTLKKTDEKLMKDDPDRDPQEAINRTAFAKNKDTNQTGFSPML